MKAQEYLDTLIEECRIFNEKSIEYKDIYAKLFPDVTDNTDARTKILAMKDDELKEYFKSSQVMLDVQSIFMKLASFVYFCKHIDIELDLNKIQDVPNLPNFIANFVPFHTELFTNSEGEIKEKQSKEFNKKFEVFKSSVGKITNIT